MPICLMYFHLALQIEQVKQCIQVITTSTV